MKTLIINGSPRKNGGTSSIISELRNHLKSEIAVVDTYYTSVAPCVDCRYCWTNPKCAIDDEMQKIYKYINEVDNIIIASPIYFGELSGSLLNFASRFQYLWTSKNFRKESVLQNKIRYGAVILVDGGDGFMDTAFSMGKRLLRVMGAEFKQLIYFSGTDKSEPINPIDNNGILNEVKKLVTICNR